MLSSIHPLGERARHNRWALTVAAFTLASTATGAAVGAALGLAGSLLPDGRAPVYLGVTAAIALTAGLLDALRVRPPGPERQVNEHWIGTYRGWVYGGAFGAQLGSGVATFVVTWGVYATFAAELFSASMAGGAVIGAVFGFGRAIAPLAAGWIDRPSRLTRFHAAMAGIGAPTHRIVATGLVVAGAAGILGSTV